MRTWLFTPLAFAALTLAGCTKDEDTGETGETGDADTDTDSDTDTDVTYESFTGDVTFTRTSDDTTLCDVTVSLASTEAYVGDCANCAFGFKVDATETENNNTDGCVKDFAYYGLTFQSGAFDNNDVNGSLADNWIGFAASADVYYGYVNYANSLIIGGSYNSDDYTDYPIMSYVPTEYTYTSSYGTYGPYPTGSTTSFDGTNLAFEIAFEDTSYEDLIGNDCDATTGEEGSAAVTGEVPTLDGELSCTDSKVDVYTVTAAADAVIAISVDTTDAATIGDPYLTIYDASGCTVGESDDAFDCTVQPTDADSADPYGYCSAYGFTAPAAGDYTVVVANAYACYTDTQTTWTYRLAVSGATNVVLAEADADQWLAHTEATSAVGTGVAVAQ